MGILSGKVRMWLDMLGAIAQYWRLSAQNPTKILMKRINFGSKQWYSEHMNTSPPVVETVSTISTNRIGVPKTFPSSHNWLVYMVGGLLCSCLGNAWKLQPMSGRCSRPLHWDVHQWFLQFSNIILEDLLGTRKVSEASNPDLRQHYSIYIALMYKT